MEIVHTRALVSVGRNLTRWPHAGGVAHARIRSRLMCNLVTAFAAEQATSKKVEILRVIADILGASEADKQAVCGRNGADSWSCYRPPLIWGPACEAGAGGSVFVPRWAC